MLGELVDRSRKLWRSEKKVTSGKAMEVLFLTKCDTAALYSPEKVDRLHAFAKEKGIELCKEVMMPSDLDLSDAMAFEGMGDHLPNAEEIATSIKKDLISLLI